ncbi:MAG: nucleotidyltransferase domain-containing protein [Candidatus Micrarchaeia archaeon]|jgi:predicted nucleotidyltransferase
MLKILKTFKGWKVIEYFLKNPNKIIHIKGLSRELKISPRTSEIYCKKYSQQNILSFKKFANTSQYSLNNNHYLVKSLKQMFILSLINEAEEIKHFIKQNNIDYLYLYGSYSKGEYSNMSDLDLLIITNNKKLDVEELLNFGEKNDLKIETTIYTITEWIKKEKSEFGKNINKIEIYKKEI